MCKGCAVHPVLYAQYASNPASDVHVLHAADHLLGPGYHLPVLLHASCLNKASQLHQKPVNRGVTGHVGSVQLQAI